MLVLSTLPASRSFTSKHALGPLPQEKQVTWLGLLGEEVRFYHCAQGRATPPPPGKTLGVGKRLIFVKINKLLTTQDVCF